MMSIVLSVGVGVVVLSAGVVAACECVRRKNARKQQMSEASSEIDEILKAPGVKTVRTSGIKTRQPVTDMTTCDVEAYSVYERTKIPGEVSSSETEEQEETDDNDIVDVPECSETITESKHSTLFDAEGLRLITAAVTDDDLKGLMEDRVAEFIEDSRHRDDCALSAVDFMDELSCIESAYSEPLVASIVKMKTVILDGLQKADYEILDSDVWNPDIQRAVKISHVLEPDSFPQIAVKRATGLRCQGRLIRKQEVEILKS